MSNDSDLEKVLSHPWKFFRAGGFDQVRLDSSADLTALDQLDQKLWVALSCPTQGLVFDSKTLDLIDTDKDGRIRAPDILAAVRWACSMLRDPGDLLKSSDSLPIRAISDATPEARQVRESARQILVNLGKGDAESISLDDTADTERIFVQTVFNGDGIIPAESATDEATQTAIVDVMACLGAETDRSGKPGVSQAKVDQFFAEAQAYSDWWAHAEEDSVNVLPLGEDTVTAAASLAGVRVKVDDYFARSRLAGFDNRALAAVNRQESEYLAIAAKDMTITAEEVANFPLAQIEANKPLPLAQGVNPAWTDKVAKFQSQVVRPVLGERDAITEADWVSIKTRFAAFEAWAAGKAGSAVEKLGLKRVRELLASGARAAITALVAKDKALEPHANAIAAVEKLLRFNRDLYKLLNNFVSFRDFYGRKDKAVFQAGTLYLDQRSCELCLRVDDMGRHAILAHLSGTYLLYCECVRRSTGQKITIAAAMTAGDSDNLMVGRNGIFYDRDGQDWDATVVKILENPISIRQAFWSPYKRLVRWIGDQVAKRAAAADTAASSKLISAVPPATADAQAGKPPEPRPKMDVGVVAALGVAVGGITAALGALLQAFFGLGSWMPLGLVALILLISGPSIVIAWLKLRQRNLGPLLDANGWAVNAKAKINLPFGRSLTSAARLPKGAGRDMTDLFGESNRGRNVAVAMVIILPILWGTWYFGAIEWLLPDVLQKSAWVVKHQAAAKGRDAKAVTPTSAPAK